MRTSTFEFYLACISGVMCTDLFLCVETCMAIITSPWTVFVHKCTDSIGAGLASEADRLELIADVSVCIETS